ncbi:MULTISPECIES: class I SAM-dependent methyltransferase [Actinomadura]|uniref:Class I SAM-dependent methyltransferase n=1 Tax=Actinomadura yumaensis TaxID=111807 RepID=A0ABW2CRS1_9ACTN|nr:class I SAM-dependent methyltransferase [Actinomadura sp. J1-007]
MTAVLSRYARRKKLDHFFAGIDKDARVLEVGCADGWVGQYAVAGGWQRFTGIDAVAPPAAPPHPFVLGDVRQWPRLGLEPGSYDVVVAFDVIEHGDLFDAMAALLRPGGRLMVTTPVPHLDWACRLLECLGLAERRTSPRTHLIYLRDLPEEFRPVETSVRGGLSQWGVFERVPHPSDADGPAFQWAAAQAP